MSILKMFSRGLWFGLAMFALIFVGDFFVPGKLASTVFSPLGILIIFVCFMMDMIWMSLPVDKKGAAEK